jgi:hypothetical protein
MTTRRLVRSILMLIVLTLGVSPVSAGVLAQATPEAKDVPPAFLFHPKDEGQSYFAIEMEAGTEQAATVVIGNAGEAPVTARTFAADAYSLVNGGFGVREDGEAVSGTTTWLDYEAVELELPPTEAREQEFTVTVPEGTAPGQYITGLVVQTAEPIAVGTSSMLRQTIRKAIAVLITVPGEVAPEFSIGEASLRQSVSANSLLVDIENSGNVLVKPEGTITVTSSDGVELVQAPIAMGSVYAGTATQIEVPIPLLLEPGSYEVAVSLSDAETGAVAEADLGLDVAANAEATPDAVDVVTSFTVETSADASGAVQFADVSAQIGAGTPLPSVKVTLHVSRDGELVEDYQMSASLAVPADGIAIQQRYIPAEGWQPGTYTFALTVEAVDLATGQSTLLQTVESASDVVVP